MFKLAIALVALGGGAYGGALLAYRQYKIATLTRHPPAIHVRSAVRSDCSILILGDSRVSQWVLPSARGLSISKVGYNGGSTGTILRAAPAWLRPPPNILVLQVGINDLSVAALLSPPKRRTTVAAAADNIVELARTALRAGVERVIVTSVTPPAVVAAWKRPLYGRKYARLAAELNGALTKRLPARNVEFLIVDAIVRRFEDPPRIHWGPNTYRAINDVFIHKLDGKSCAHQPR